MEKDPFCRPQAGQQGKNHQLTAGDGARQGEDNQGRCGGNHARVRPPNRSQAPPGPGHESSTVCRHQNTGHDTIRQIALTDNGKSRRNVCLMEPLPAGPQNAPPAPRHLGGADALHSALFVDIPVCEATALTGCPPPAGTGGTPGQGRQAGRGRGPARTPAQAVAP